MQQSAKVTSHTYSKNTELLIISFSGVNGVKKEEEVQQFLQQ